jgi:hypothetical protein
MINYKESSGDYSWKKLQESFTRIQENHPDWLVFSKFDRANWNPKIKERDISRLVEEGWELKFYDDESGSCMLEQKEIYLFRKSNGFHRDRVLSHEIVHAIFQELKDSWGQIYAQENRIICEYIGRKIRANVDLLRCMISTFGLEPQIYDNTSYLAFAEITTDLEKQLCFPFAQEYWNKLKIVRME